MSEVADAAPKIKHLRQMAQRRREAHQRRKLAKQKLKEGFELFMQTVQIPAISHKLSKKAQEQLALAMWRASLLKVMPVDGWISRQLKRRLDVVHLEDNYVKECLGAEKGLAIPSELLEVKRTQLTILRKCREERTRTADKIVRCMGQA